MKFYVDTSYPVAWKSPDHLYPLATKKDNTINLDFNKHLLRRLKQRPLSILDLGCAGGGMVESFLAMGQIAVGIEGSDYNLLNKRAAWATIPEYLFTADATRPFTVHIGDGVPYQFDVITAWEFFEHIKEHDLPGVMENIERHLKPNGYLFVTTNDDSLKRNRIEYHLTKQDHGWWKNFFRVYGLFVDKVKTLSFDRRMLRDGKYKLVLTRREE